MYIILVNPAIVKNPIPIKRRYSLKGFPGELLVNAIAKITKAMIKITGAKIQKSFLIFIIILSMSDFWKDRE